MCAVRPVSPPTPVTARCIPSASGWSGNTRPNAASQSGRTSGGMNTPEMNDRITAVNGPTLDTASTVGVNTVIAMPRLAITAAPSAV